MSVYMKKALALAKRGLGKVEPNPMVACIIVKNSKIISSSYHKKFGENHAEVNAINEACESVKGATMYVSLEPCAHFGKTGPCIEKIIESGIEKVVIACLDPNPLVCGKGVEKLKASGIMVELFDMQKEAKELNKKFFVYIKEKRPYVILKYAMSLDGKIATKNFDSKWISSFESRKHVHKQRSENSCILVGVNTILKDNPSLDVRYVKGKNPVKVILDSKLLIPLESNIFKTGKSIIFTLSKDKKKIAKYEKLNAEVISFNEKIDVKKVLDILYKKGYMSVYVEGGASVNWSFIEQNLVDEINVYISGKIIGASPLSPINGKGFEYIKDCPNFSITDFKKIGEDIFVSARNVGEKCLQD